MTQRLLLLKDVERLASTLGASVDAGSTCETAGHFYLYHISPRCAQFRTAMASIDNVPALVAAFPFSAFFSDAPQPLFDESSLERSTALAAGCIAHVEAMFTKLEEYRPFELLHKVFGL